MVSDVSPPVDLAGASDQDVVARARQGSEEAYRELLRRYQGPVFSLIYRMVGEREAAEDLAQETFGRMVTALDSYRPELKFSPWLLRIANNAAIDHLRRRRLDTVALDGWPDGAGPGATAIQAAERSESTPATVDPRALRSALEHAIGRLREQYRRCIVLRHMEERSYDDIAEIMDLPVGTVKTYLHRARDELREMLGHLRDPSLRYPAVAKRET